MILDSRLAFICNISKESAEKCEGYLNNFRPQFVDLKALETFMISSLSISSTVYTNGIYKFNDYLYDEFINL